MAAVQLPGLGLVRLLPVQAPLAPQAPQVLQVLQAQKALQTQVLLQVH
jgi:hypothetical protein